MIADDKIAEIRARTDLNALIGQYVKLQRHGGSYRGLCPFHAEKTPSFYVHPARHFFHCFGCQASGDAIAFLMRLEGLSFPEATRNLAERCGIVVLDHEPRADPEAERQREDKERSFALLECAATFFVRQLQSHAAAHLAQRELTQRRIEPATAASFRLGFAPPGWDSLGQHLRRHGFAERDAETLGLLVPKRDGIGNYDRFRQRLMFPVFDTAGRIIGFSGRHLELENAAEATTSETTPAPKYVNSPESALYHKGDALYGLHQARVAIRQQGCALLCEGNFDVVALHQAGLTHAVAPLGTAFTESQAKLLRRYCDQLVVLFDGDAAGQKAVQQMQPLLQRFGFTSRVATLPSGEDPESFLRRQPAKQLRQRIDAAPSIIEYLVDRAALESSGHPAMRAAAVAALKPLLTSVENPLERRLYIEHVARRFEIHDLDAVQAQLFADDGNQGRTANGARPTPALPRQRSAKSSGINRSSHVEFKLFGLLLDQPQLFASEEATRLHELLTNSHLRAIFPVVSEQASLQGGFDASTVLHKLEELEQVSSAMPMDQKVKSEMERQWPAVKRWFEGRLVVQRHPQAASAREELRAGVSQLARRRLQRRCSVLKAHILTALRQGDTHAAEQLSAERRDLERLSQHNLWLPADGTTTEA